MTDAVNFFQSIFTFMNFAAPPVNRYEIELADELKTEARMLAETAAEEMKNAKIAQRLGMSAKDAKKFRALTEIAVWHYSRAAEKYAKSARRFEESGKIRCGKIHAFDLKAKLMTRRAERAERAAGCLSAS